MPAAEADCTKDLYSLCKPLCRRWRSFVRGGSVAFYVFLYSLGFMFNTLHLLSGVLSITLYLTYMGIAVWGLYLGLGTIGFLVSFTFTYLLYSNMKVLSICASLYAKAICFTNLRSITHLRTFLW